MTAPTPSAPWYVRVALLASGLWVALYAVHLADAGALPGALSGRWIHIVVMAVATGVVLLRGLHGDERLPWLLLGAASLCWIAGEVWYTALLWNDASPPVPSPADAGYLAFVPLAFAGLVCLLRSRAPHVGRTAWVDGITAALAGAALAAAVVFEPVLRATGGRPLAVATNLAYPVSDVVLLAIVSAAIVVSGRRIDRVWLVLGVGLAAYLAADTTYLLETASGTFSAGGISDVGWWLAPVATGTAAWRRRPLAVGSREAQRQIAVPLAFASIALALLVIGSFRPLGLLATVLAGASVAAVMTRLWLTFRESTARALQSHRQARTDVLTGLGNYRRLQEDLERAIAAAASGASYVLAVFDLDGFKAYNDAYGHPAGDRLLGRIAAYLHERIEPDGSAYRIGGDEFCVLVGAETPAAGRKVETILATLGSGGHGFPVAGSAGIVQLPAEAATADVALALADRRMYDVKDGVRRNAAVQTRDALVRTLAEYDPALPGHGDAVMAISVAVAVAMDLDVESVERVRHAACLHDVGKVGVPREILDKPAPLDAAEWRLVREHTLIGERILAAAPALAAVAALVRASHEHFDGSGYPDGLAGTAIPLEARIVTACDAYDAMLAERPYRGAREPAEALAELERCAGSQFDPAVVACLASVVGAALRDAA